MPVKVKDLEVYCIKCSGETTDIYPGQNVKKKFKHMHTCHADEKKKEHAPQKNIKPEQMSEVIGRQTVA